MPMDQFSFSDSQKLFPLEETLPWIPPNTSPSSIIREKIFAGEKEKMESFW